MIGRRKWTEVSDSKTYVELSDVISAGDDVILVGERHGELAGGGVGGGVSAAHLVD